MMEFGQFLLQYYFVIKNLETPFSPRCGMEQDFYSTSPTLFVLPKCTWHRLSVVLVLLLGKEYLKFFVSSAFYDLILTYGSLLCGEEGSQWQCLKRNWKKKTKKKSEKRSEKKDEKKRSEKKTSLLERLFFFLENICF